MKSPLHQPALVILMALCSICFQPSAEAKIFFVSISATGASDGSSWTNAMTDLQIAVDLAAEGDTICVAAGTYLPTHLLGTDSVRNVTFYINKDVLIYGGFSGVPGTEGSTTDRNPKVHLTTLSGDTGIPGTRTDNAFHVVYFDHVSDTTRVDGFIITDGYGFDGFSGLDGTGAGIYNDASNTRSHPIIANCIIRNCSSQEGGAGMVNYAPNGGHANPLLINCSFIENDASGGGAITNYADEEGEANPVLIGCSFKGNTARTADGGAMSCIAHSALAAPKFVNCVISGNHSPNSSAFQAFVTGTGIATPEFINCTFSGNTGGAIRAVDLGTHNSVVTIRNCIIFGNAGGMGITTNGATVNASFSIIPFGFPGEGIIGLDPLFVSPPPLDSAHTLGDVHLQDASPAIDAGRNEDVPSGILTDLDGKPRFVNPFGGPTALVDIGPYEVQSITTSTSDFLSDADWSVYPNPANDLVTVTVSAIEVGAQLQMLDAKGNIISRKQLSTGQSAHVLNVSLLPTGIYYIHLVLDGLQDVKKIIIQ